MVASRCRTAVDDPGNFVNRSPYPMIHILQQASVTTAVDSHPDSLEVPNINRRLLHSLGATHMKQLIRSAMEDVARDG